MSRTTSDGPDFASASPIEHVVRGVVGFGALIGAVALIPVVGPIGLLLLPVGLIALRGCPMCWTIGLVQTISRGRLQRSCGDDRCTLTVAGREGAAR
ncbi:hypothetical protein [Nocardia sienata]|uniref:hypothetical protein n=1 Tax=Nocardia sienata TaxID=248552 RepID=UPI0007A52ECF|nr:hypothetical protein [Nocardia sienata]